MAENTRTRNPRGRGELLRAEILHSAVALIDETNDATTLTLRGIARRTGISAPSIYSHFANLPELIGAVLELSFEQLADSVRTAMDAAPDAEAELITAGNAYVEFGWSHKARYRLMFAEDGYAENAVQTFALVSTALQRCVAAGVSSSTNPDTDTWMIWAALHGVATLDKPARPEQLRLGPLDRPAMLETIVRRLAQLRAES